jgi:serine/threonine protein kinase
MDFARYILSPPLRHVFELSQCTLPHGETVFGHVMELVEGVMASAETVRNLELDETGIFNLVRELCHHSHCLVRLGFQADSAAMAVCDIHQYNIAHGDISGHNVIIQHNASTQDCNVVLLDFAFCRLYVDPSLQSLCLEIDIDG